MIPQTKQWDVAQQRYVNGDLAAETFGPLEAYGIDNVVVMPLQRKGGYISTYTSRFWPMDPRASEVKIEDIAHSLGMQVRYAGHCKRFYSVAEHSVLIAKWLLANGHGERAALAGLLHDVPEAYLVDVPRPVKKELAGYKAIEEKIWWAVAARFGLSPYLPDVVHEADSRIIADEMADNLHEVDPNYTNPLGVWFNYWSPDQAEFQFLVTLRLLMDMRAAA